MVEPSKELQAVFDKAVKDAKVLKHEYVTLEHLLYAMLCEETFSTIVNGYGADVEYMKKELELYLKTKLDDIKGVLEINMPTNIDKDKIYWKYLS